MVDDWSTYRTWHTGLCPGLRCSNLVKNLRGTYLNLDKSKGRADSLQILIDAIKVDHGHYTVSGRKNCYEGVMSGIFRRTIFSF